MNSDTADNAVNARNGKNVFNVLGYAWESQATPLRESIPPKAAKQLVAFVFAAPSVPTL
ncbi:MAG TPA: hypothetical protein VN957_08685 [Chthoniobacterales bacterium]|jgi:hypothetical protein|nr:hypothetical protein [Chthoniobacterales bacterium]